jgi:integrase
MAMGKRKGLTTDDPWPGSMGIKARTVKGVRAYTIDEIKALAKADGPTEMKEVTLLALHTGARLGEIVDARAGDFDGEGFFVAGSKTPAGKRWEPLLGVALAIVKRRAKGRPSADPLWPEFTAGGPDGKKSHAASKRWNRWRKEFLPDTQIDFHSLRRFWTTMAEQAGVDAVTVARLLGHSSPVWSLATYSAGQQRKQLISLPSIMMSPMLMPMPMRL